MSKAGEIAKDADTVPRDGAGEVVTRPVCRICGSHCGQVAVSGPSTYFRCTRCDTLQKVLTPEQFAALRPIYDPAAIPRETAETLERSLEIGAKIELLERLAGRGDGRWLLDVGCGSGGYALAARKLGYEVMGIEPSAPHAAAGRELLGLDIVNDVFTPDKVGGHKFDVIMLSHVIEHILDPAAFVSDLLSVLAPGGRLIMATPNAGSLIAKTLGLRWPMLYPVDHVSMLSPKSIAHILPPGYTAKIETDEYPHEFAASLASAVRDINRPANADMLDSAQTPTFNRPALSMRAMRLMLRIASLPFYWWGKATARNSCLVVSVVCRTPSSA